MGGYLQRGRAGGLEVAEQSADLGGRAVRGDLDRIRRVWLWSEWPGAWGADAGIDLVAEDRDGGLWAVQAKAYDPSYSIRKADVDSFLSESGVPRSGVELCLVDYGADPDTFTRSHVRRFSRRAGDET